MWGLAFKPNTDDIREAPALKLIDRLIDEGCSVQVYDPEAMENVKRLYGNKITYRDSHMDALRNCDALVIMTEWSVFRNPNLDTMHELIKDKVIFDGRNLYQPEEFRSRGFNYSSIGRP